MSTQSARLAAASNPARRASIRAQQTPGSGKLKGTASPVKVVVRMKPILSRDLKKGYTPVWRKNGQQQIEQTEVVRHSAARASGDRALRCGPRRRALVSGRRGARRSSSRHGYLRRVLGACGGGKAACYSLVCPRVASGPGGAS